MNQTSKVHHKDQLAQTGEFVVLQVTNWNAKPIKYVKEWGGVFDPERKTWLVKVATDTHRNHLRTPSIYGLGIVFDGRKS